MKISHQASITAVTPGSQSTVKVSQQAPIIAVTPVSQSNVKVSQQTSMSAVTPLSQSNVKGTDHQSTRTVLTNHMGKWGEYTITSTSVQLSPENAYRNGLYRYKAAHKLKVGVYALAEHKENGCLTTEGRRKYVIVECIYLLGDYAYVCSCDTKKRRFILTHRLWDSTDMCLHSIVAAKTWPGHDFDLEERSFGILNISPTLMAVYSEDTSTYSILRKTKKIIKCLTCKQLVTKCVHVKVYNNQIDSN